MPKAIMTKVPEFARPHEFDIAFSMGMLSAVVDNATILPIVTYDEGLGVINSYKSNPQNASFAEYAGAKCYPTSRINKFFAKATFDLSKGFRETNKLAQLTFATMEIHTSFMDGQLAEDEVSGLDLNEILELQNESTDRQTFGLYNTVDLDIYKQNAQLDMEVGQEGLDTDIEIEGVAFNPDDYYDCLHYYTNGNKLRAITGKLKWHVLSMRHPSKTVYFNQDSSTKYMNPYAFNGVLVFLPLLVSPYQYGTPADGTDIPHLGCRFQYRYNEYNHEFNHSLQ